MKVFSQGVCCDVAKKVWEQEQARHKECRWSFLEGRKTALVGVYSHGSHYLLRYVSSMLFQLLVGTSMKLHEGTNT